MIVTRYPIGDIWIVDSQGVIITEEYQYFLEQTERTPAPSNNCLSESFAFIEWKFQERLNVIKMGHGELLKYDKIQYAGYYLNGKKKKVVISKPKKRKNVTHYKERLLLRDGYMCGWCHLPMNDSQRLAVDHIHPISKGGSNEMNNLRVLHFGCNAQKGAKTITSRKELLNA